MSKTVKRVLKWKLAAALAAAACLFFLLVGAFLSITGGNTPALMRELNEAYDVPVEMREVIDTAAQENGIPWTDLAAFLGVRFSYRLPGVPRRPALVPDDTPLMREMAELKWRGKVLEWLRDYLKEHGTDLAADLSPEQQDQYEEKRQMLAAVDQALKEDPDGWHKITESEVYTPVLYLLEWEYTFPVEGGTFADDWGNDRPQNEGYASTRHQGTDVFVPRGTPIHSVGEGVIESIGWNVLGGRTVTIRDEPTGVQFYYAHMQGYASGLFQGAHVSRSQVIGYVGTSGEGPDPTDNVIAEPHLHLGVYLDGLATDPYPYLLSWRKKLP